MVESTETSDEALRHRALHTALAALGETGHVLLQTHPEVDRIAPPRVLEPLEWIQWDELEALQKRCELGTELCGLARGPEAYLVDRRQLQLYEAWRIAAAQMPATWRRVLRLGAQDVQALMGRLGEELATRAARAVDRQKLEVWLAPLGAERARSVAAALISRRGEPARPLEAEARALYEEELKAGIRGERLVTRLGRRALAASLLAVPEEVRRPASRAAWSNLLAVLERTVPLPIPGAAESRGLEELVLSALAAGEDPPPSGRTQGGLR